MSSRLVLPAPFSVERVVGRHDARHALLDHSLEVGQVDAIEHVGPHPHVDLEPGVLDAVAGEVLGAAHDVPLQTTDEGRAHLADVVGVLAVGLLRAAPARVAEQVEARGQADVGALGARLPSDRFAYALFQRVVEAGGSCHGDGEAGGYAAGDAAGTIDEVEPAETQPGNGGGRVERWLVARAGRTEHVLVEVLVSGEQAQPLCRLHPIQQFARTGFDLWCCRRYRSSPSVDAETRPLAHHSLGHEA